MNSHAAVAFGMPFVGLLTMLALTYCVARFNRKPKNGAPKQYSYLRASSVSWHVK